MKYLSLLSIFALLIFAGYKALAQAKYSISGTVTSESGHPLKSATVFLSGSQRITLCNDAGHFQFDDIDEGNYRLIVTMVGRSAFSKSVVVRGQSIQEDVKLVIKPTVLNQVNIGGKDDWKGHFKLFREAFLGTTKNAKACVIVNPKVINFSTKKGILLADADDFLVIENPNLGYRIKYLLKDFGYNKVTDLTLYNGETSFEPMTGTPDQQKKWEQNRLEAYKGSTMHFLRSVYQNTVLQEGFIINQVYKEFNDPLFPVTESHPRVLIDQRQVKFDSLVNVVDTSFISLKFKSFMFTYNPAKAKSIKLNRPYAIMSVLHITDNTTIIKLYANEAVIDRAGAHRDFRDFLIEGALAKDRVGDQLPYEYHPPVGQ